MEVEESRSERPVVVKSHRMFHPLSLFVGLRYVRARTHKFFVSFITWAALAGVMLGVIALIVILSVMNGLENELRDRLLSLSAHARVVAAADLPEGTVPSAAEWDKAVETVRTIPGVKGVAPYAEIQALAVHTPEMQPVVLRGIDPAREVNVTSIAKSVFQGTLKDLVPGTDRVILGEVVAQDLGLAIGDSISILIPTIAPNGAPAPQLREYQVAGVFAAGSPDHDSTLVLSDLETVRPLAAGNEGLRVLMDDSFTAPIIAAQMRKLLPATFEVIDWTQDNASYFRAIRIEKTMMGIILMLVVAVAAFSIVAMLVMVVTDKRTDIAILRTLGASPGRVVGVFLSQGLVIGWVGVGLGVLFGVILAYNADPIMRVLEKTFGFQMWDSDVYYVTTLPTDVQWPMVAGIAVAAFLLTGLATIYPAWRASRVEPAEALRYE
jgi:lipoprotein-releasing system permease protein